MKSFEDLCRENYGRIYKYIFALTGSRDDAEDLAQDVFTVAFESAGDLFDTLARELDSQIDETAYAGTVVGSLDASRQALYTRRYVDRVPIRELARETGVGEPAMRMRLLRLRSEIRDIVAGLKLEEF